VTFVAQNPNPDPDLATRLVTTAGDAIVIADPEGRIITWNRGAETMFGFPTAEALGTGTASARPTSGDDPTAT